jgi:hypothetical protein
MRVTLALAALVAFFVFRHRSNGTVEPQAMSDDPVSPELALVDPSLRDRLILEQVVTEDEAGEFGRASDVTAGVDGGWSPQRRRTIVVAAAVVLTVAAICLGVALFMTHGRDAAAPDASKAAASASPTASLKGGPGGRDFAWAPVKGALRYDIQIRRAGEIVYSTTTSVPHVRIPGRWQRRGRTFLLSSGTYRWYVWPVLASGAHNRRGPAVVATTVTVR